MKKHYDFSKGKRGRVLSIALDRETDGRWIAEVPELNVLLYGDSRDDATRRAQSAAREIAQDKATRGKLAQTSKTKTSR